MADQLLGAQGLTWETVATPSWAPALHDRARAAGEKIAAGLAVAREYGHLLPMPGSGATAARWRLLADVAGVDLTAARILEAHSDALAILGEAGEQGAGSTWGVFAAEAPAVSLVAQPAGDGWRLSGTKPWCSLGSQLDRALVTAHIGAPDGPRRLFAVDLGKPSVRTDTDTGWVARGLRNVASGPVHFHDTPADPVGAEGWYLSRPGFAWGGIGVAACWFGGASALADGLRQAGARRAGELAAMHVGAVEAALHAAATTLLNAAQLVDAGSATGAAGELLALRVRAIVAEAAERTISHTRHALGPAPLAFDEEHARRVADLEMYVGQHHAERDLAALGARVMASEPG